ncbi:GNAT family N-acetyltransferase [Azospirillum halopraeferens]|uniref:GNAT family N-acetyltransferase n=1 Tax=Azospirillum halopraeferens TaxID=34010 RepID=UPI0004180A77|nr:GNAT family N-acetyltransferase [Azospirillum halopraeferens]
MIDLRDAGPGDLAAMLAIYNDAVVNTTAVYDDLPRSEDAQVRWFDMKREQDMPVLVATDPAGTVLGYASFGPFRPWPGFRHTVENSLYVAPAARGRGVGRRLLAATVERARDRGLHAMVAGIDADNAVSLHLHRSLGFVEVARMPEVGRKFDRWLDLVFLQRML